MPQQRHSFRDQRTAFAVEVDGRGRLESLRLPDDALHRAHPETVGGDILAAVRSARQAAAEDVQRQIDRQDSPARESTQPEPQPAPPSGAATSSRMAPRTTSWRARPARPSPPDDGPDELFTGLWGDQSR